MEKTQKEIEAIKNFLVSDAFDVVDQARRDFIALLLNQQRVGETEWQTIVRTISIEQNVAGINGFFAYLAKSIANKEPEDKE
jgi:hypothetical protein